MHVVEGFGGGVFEMVTAILRGLNANGFEQVLVYSLRPETPANFDRLLPASVRLIHLPMERGIRPQRDLAAMRRLRRLLRAEQPDVVHLHSSKAGVLGRLATWRMAGTRTFYTPHGYAFLRQDIGRLWRHLYWVLEWCASRAGGTVLACSPSEMKLARGLTTTAVLVPNTIDAPGIQALAMSHSAPALTPQVVVAICGRITFARGPGLFAAVARQAGTILGDGIQFVWIGGGESSAEIESAGVKVTGWLARPRAVGQLATADIYLHTSLWEGLPLAILEAMCLAKPVVATRVVGNCDVVQHGVTGFLGSTAEDLTAAVTALAQDPALRARMGAAGRASVLREYNHPVMMRHLEELYGGPRVAARAGAGRA